MPIKQNNILLSEVIPKNFKKGQTIDCLGRDHLKVFTCRVLVIKDKTVSLRLITLGTVEFILFSVEYPEKGAIYHSETKEPLDFVATFKNAEMQLFEVFHVCSRPH